MHDQDRITGKMNIVDCACVLSEGNPGAATAIAALIATSPRIDPSSWMGPLQPLLYLDNYRIYGSDIWILFKNICGHNPKKVCLLFRSVQMGLMDERLLKEAVRTGRHNFNFDTLLERLQSELPDFMANETLVTAK